ncbi:MAG: hypothetical protein ACERLG_11265 [Sedimentibacter sp.]
MKNKLSINLEVSLVEIIMSVFIFAIAGVIMINCFAIARFTQIKANDIVISSNIVQSDMEFIRATKNYNEVDEFLVSNYSLSEVIKSDNLYIKYYDVNWVPCNDDKKEYKISTNVSTVQVNSGKMESIRIVAEKLRPYPFISKEKNQSYSIYSIESKKFFPLDSGGR